MTVEQIERFLDSHPLHMDRSSRVFFKTRNTLDGTFIQAPDFVELKKKNFWRIVSASRMEDYRKSNDVGLSRIFNGSEFTKLATATSSV